MSMSKSRLEKFLYALYSLDSSDLPTPLSRIEELYNCWVTGEEVPTFEPLSRVEKYLMAILGVYDVDSLPNPLSRVEVLLYKLATGDDNLDDVKSFLSEHEELLAEIIRNGGAGGNINIEYVLYTLSTEFNTLYNTSEKPIKSAILKGQTLVNLSLLKEFVFSGSNNSGAYDCAITLQINKSYIMLFDLTNSTSVANTDTIAVRGWLSNGDYREFGRTIKKFDNGRNFVKITSTEGDIVKLLITCSFATEMKNIMVIEYQDGMENWDIPYFEGMQSVKMPVLTTTGKNLFDKTKFLRGYYVNESTGVLAGNGKNTFYSSTDFIEIQPNKELIHNDTYKRYAFYDKNKIFISGGNHERITSPSNAKYLRWSFTIDTEENYQIEYGSTSTQYEPFKSNILTVNEDVELRGIGGVKDELNLLTGELTQRIGEVVLDGSEKWDFNGDRNTAVSFICSSFNGYLNEDKVMSSEFPTITDGNKKDVEMIRLSSKSGKIIIHILKTKASTSTELKAWLSQNPITVQYELATESVKTVDLSVVDQDGNNTELSTFDDLTHVTLSSEGLIPEAELEVATKNEEVLNTMSLEMDDILTTQTTLEETSNTQSENVDATMLATTEIYEGLL